MRYAAFLSYSHADARWAQWLHRRLEAYRVPAHLVGTDGRHGPIPARLGTVFRDRDELPTAGDLGASIRGALADSAALVVICSPAAARSRWVEAEVQAFQALGRGEAIAAFIVAGTPDGRAPETACFPPALLAPGADGRAREPLAADARRAGDGRERAFLRLVAGLLGVSYDALARREVQRRQRRLLALTGASVLGMTIALGLAFTAQLARNDAQRRQAQAEDLLGFMLGDLRARLATVGRLDLMRTVDDKATAYFAALQPRDLSDRALEAQARSLTGIGQVRLDEGKHDQAMAAFREAYARSRALAERQPDNGQRLFDRAQAEYWIGLVFWRQGRYDPAQAWLTRYRDSALRLAALDPANFAWQREVAYGHHNLAVLDQERGRRAQAERALRAELALYRSWVQAHPRDTGLRDELATVASWLGSLARDDGRLAQAQALFEEQVGQVARNRADEPDNAVWKKSWLDARVLLAAVQTDRGDLAAARRNIAQASALARALARQDPGNRDWQRALGYCAWWQARLDTESAPARAADAARAAEQLFAAMRAAEPKDDSTLRWLLKTRLLQAELALRRGAPDAAATSLAQVQADLAPAWARSPDSGLRLQRAQLQLLQGELAAARGDAKAARSAWAQAEQTLRAGLGDPPAFERLEWLVRALQAQHRERAAAPYLARLQRSGFVPLPAWRPAPVRTLTAAP